MNPLLSADNLYRRFPGHQAVAGVALTLRRGDILGLLGRNGAGKSTTLRMLAGALCPDRGEVAIDGEPLHRGVRARIGYLPEHPPLYAELRVDEYLRFAARLRGLSGGRLRRSVDTTLEACGLTPRHKRLCGQLSKGYRQRLGIAQAIVHDPDVVILDEPGNGLDPVQNRDIRALIHQLAETKAIILSSHVLSEIETLCNRVLLLHAGKVVFDSPLPLASAGRRIALHASGTDVTALKAIAGVTDARADGGDRFLLTLADDGDPAAINRALCAAGITVSAFCPAGDSLEQLFNELDR